ncbi:ABC transporter ATP-binding protein [Paenibacillus farraposensis]|uniref:ABC transporter ATP-binding protein n=1 Tax=Paenibacillus farraposensis TaxID=2807095 RepID=A0ABW4DAF7_9BACL|nr:ABC transporter ATP-binding protein [Paenibacillus farraposensis]MCC3379987.1 ABC transporter ATP-binding protein [Paenibacillus farraposensis]
MEPLTLEALPQTCCVCIKHVDRLFGKKQVLFNINLNIPYSQIFGILGPSGSGKTTLVKMIAGVDEATNGEVYVLDKKMPLLSILKEIGYMAQADALYGELTTAENLYFFASMFKMSYAKKQQRIKEVLDLVDLTSFINRQVKHFSGGMKRRLSLAIALLHEPPILILDEPTVGIDPVLRMSIWKELGKLRDNGTTIIVTTHVMDELERCDKLGMIRDGKLIASGSPGDLKARTSSSTIEEAFLHFIGEHR